MSHLVTIEARIMDLSAVHSACITMGWEFVEGAASFAWWGYPKPEQAPCSHKIVVPGSKYEIGLVKSEDGTCYQPRYDDMLCCKKHGSLTAANGLAGFLREYELEKTRRFFKRKGIRFTERRENGHVVVTANV